MKHIRTGTWSKDEHEAFLKAWKEGLSDGEIADRVGTRVRKQVVSHRQKIQKKLKRHEKMKENGLFPPRPRELHRMPDEANVTEPKLLKGSPPPSPPPPPSSPTDFGVAIEMGLFTFPSLEDFIGPVATNDTQDASPLDTPLWACDWPTDDEMAKLFEMLPSPI